MVLHTLQLNLNLMLTRTVPVLKITRIKCVQPLTHVFANLHTNENPLRVTHKRTIQAHASLGTRYTYVRLQARVTCR